MRNLRILRKMLDIFMRPVLFTRLRKYPADASGTSIIFSFSAASYGFALNAGRSHRQKKRIALIHTDSTILNMHHNCHLCIERLTGAFKKLLKCVLRQLLLSLVLPALININLINLSN